MTDHCSHEKFTTEMRVKIIATAIYFFGIAAYFYTTKRSNTVVPYTGTIFGVGNLPIAGIEYTIALIGGIFTFAITPGRKRCSKCGVRWRF